MNFKTLEFDFMVVILAIGMVLIAISFWKAHKTPGFNFNAFDLIMVDGKVDPIAVSYMLVLGVTTWIIIDLRLDDKLTEGYFTTYGAMWVVPLVAKFVFKKTETPNVQTSSITSLTTSVTVSEPNAAMPEGEPSAPYSPPTPPPERPL